MDVHKAEAHYHSYTIAVSSKHGIATNSGAALELPFRFAIRCSMTNFTLEIFFLAFA
jgi:hypothetical protein